MHRPNNRFIKIYCMLGRCLGNSGHGGYIKVWNRVINKVMDEMNLKKKESGYAP